MKIEKKYKIQNTNFELFIEFYLPKPTGVNLEALTEEENEEYWESDGEVKCLQLYHYSRYMYICILYLLVKT